LEKSAGDVKPADGSGALAMTGSPASLSTSDSRSEEEAVLFEQIFA
jgi:hypothetical protein